MELYYSNEYCTLYIPFSRVIVISLQSSTDSEDQPTSMHQRDWTSLIFHKVQNLLFSSAVDAQDQARLLAVTQKEAGSWLEALPVPSLGLHLSDNELRIVTSLRLGVPTYTEHTCICNEKVGILGTHGLKCKKSKGRWSRHHSVNDIIARALTLANDPAILEPPGIVREDNKRPDGMTNIPWSHGRHLVWDYTCPDTLAPSHLQATSIEAGSAAKTAEVRKVAKYQTLAVNYTFVPIVIKTLGPIGPEAKTFLLELGRRLRQQTGEPKIHIFPITTDFHGHPEGECDCHHGVNPTWEGAGGTIRVVIFLLVCGIVCFPIFLIYVLYIIV